jgi:hypothetical protein
MTNKYQKSLLNTWNKIHKKLGDEINNLTFTLGYNSLIIRFDKINELNWDVLEPIAEIVKETTINWKIRTVRFTDGSTCLELYMWK